MADFDPRQLDQLEDALESLEHRSDLESFELAPELVERLAEYQDVLALCSEAFPIESPSDDVLASVLTEAREVSRRPRRRVGEADGSGWRQFWDRWRGTLVPSFALAGTAAVVLWLLDPGGANHSADELLSQDDPVEERDSDSSSAADAERSVSEPTPAESADESGASPEPPPAGANLSDDAPEATLGSKDEPAKLNKAKPVKPSKADAIPVAPEPAPEPMSKDETWSELEQANSARRTGNCDRARSLYDQIIAASADPLAVARAQAGVGLCFEQDRHTSEAERWFDDARSSSPGIDAWINTQRDEQPLPGETKRKRSKKAAAPDQAFDDSL